MTKTRTPQNKKLAELGFGRDDLTPRTHRKLSDADPRQPAEPSVPVRPPSAKTKRTADTISGEAKPVRKTSTAIFSDELEIQPWSTSRELWRSYEQLAVEVEDLAGHKVAVSQLIRAVLETNLPSPSNPHGLKQISDYCDRWRKTRGRGIHKSHPQNLRLKQSTIESLNDARRQLQRQEKKIYIGPVISGILSEKQPTPEHALSLIRGTE